MHITLRQLDVFVAIVQHGSLAAAAARLCITKAAVSMALQELERQLDCPLFDRVRNRLQLNNHGALLLPLADEVRQRVQHIEALFVAGEHHHGLVRIGASNTIGNYLLPALLAGFIQRYPGIEVQIQINNTRALGQALSEYGLDIVLVEGQLDDRGFASHPWLEDSLQVVAAPDHPLVGRRGVTLRDLEQQRWLLREPGSGSREQFQRLLASHLANWQLAFEFNTTESIVNGVANGLGLGLLSRMATARAEVDGRLRALDVQPPMSRRLSWVTQAGKYHHPALASFITHCQQWQPDALLGAQR